MINRLHQLIKRNVKPIIGMVHIQPTPDSPKYTNQSNISAIISDAIKQTRQLVNHGMEAIIIENMHDRPYNRASQLNPIVPSIMSIIAHQLRQQNPSLAIGIQILTAGNIEAIAVAAAADLDFIRCEGFVFGHLGDEGWMESCAASLMRYRHSIQCDHLWVLSDVKKKHSSHALTSDVSLVETIEAAQFFLTDAVVVTGTCTGIAPDKRALEEVRDTVSIRCPIILGSGIAENNIEDYFHFADSFIVGSSFKRNGHWENEIDEENVSRFMAKFRNLQKINSKN